MTPINELPVGTFCNFVGNVVYIYKNNFKDIYGLFPIVGDVPTDRLFNQKVYVYKRIKKEWIKTAKEWLEQVFSTKSNVSTRLNGSLVEGVPGHIDNLLYIENLNILNNYDTK